MNRIWAAIAAIFSRRREPPFTYLDKIAAADEPAVLIRLSSRAIPTRLS
jgi:hypothetical protein